MKKRTVFVLALWILAAGSCFCADAKVLAANRNTAARCLRLAENFLMDKDYDNALSQAELGLAYDSSISDLYYVKAAAMSSKGVEKYRLLEVVREAFRYDSWINYNKNGARVLLADLLCDMGQHEDSLRLLDEEPFIYSADAEFIRIKNLYRAGDEEQLELARQKVNTSRRIYPRDWRFPKIFFLFEYMLKDRAERAGDDYEIPELVQTIADAYIAHMPDYDRDDTEMELLASQFAQGERRERLLRAIDARGIDHPLYPILALSAGIISEPVALERFIEGTKSSVTLVFLEDFVPLVTGEAERQRLAEYLEAYEGTVFIDSDYDLQNELEIVFERGRAAVIRYDRDNDGIYELEAACDYGNPVSLRFGNENVSLTYETYPAVERLVFEDARHAYSFLNDDLILNPFDIRVPEVFEPLGTEFFVPFVKEQYLVPTETVAAQFSSGLEFPVDEVAGAVVSYTTMDNLPVYAQFSQDGKKYAECSFQAGFPVLRTVDYDGDGFYETYETFSVSENPLEKDANHEFAVRVFGFVAEDWNIFVSKIEIDRNHDTIIDFCEEYDGDGVTSSWDNDGDGSWDVRFVRRPAAADGSVTEDHIFYRGNPDDFVRVSLRDGNPFLLEADGKEHSVLAGEHPGIFWIDEPGLLDYETRILEEASAGTEQGVVSILEFAGERLSFIRIEDVYFCRIIPDSDFAAQEADYEE